MATVVRPPDEEVTARGTTLETPEFAPPPYTFPDTTVAPPVNRGDDLTYAEFLGDWKLDLMFIGGAFALFGLIGLAVFDVKLAFAGLFVVAAGFFLISLLIRR